MELRFLFSAHRLMVVYICTKFHENILNGIKVRADMIFMGKISKGHNSISSAHHLMMVYICTKFHENILEGIKIIEQTRFSKEKFQRGIIP